MTADRAHELQQRLIVTFRGEANEHLSVLGRELETFDCHAPEAELRERIEVLFRTMHTLKGASRSVGLSDIESVCHLSEALLRGLQRDNLPVTPDTVRVLQDACDAITGLLGGEVSPERLESVSFQLQQLPASASTDFGAPANPPAREQLDETCDAVAPQVAHREAEAPAPALANAPAAPAREPAMPNAKPPKDEHIVSNDARHDTIRVEVDRLDSFSTLAEDLLVPKLAAAERVRMARDLYDTLNHLRTSLRSRQTLDAASGSADPAAIVATIEDHVHAAQSASERMLAVLRKDHKVMRMTVDGLLDEIRRIRMVPARHTLEAFPRMVRDLARNTGKNVKLELVGTEIEIDRKIIELIKDPLIHMVRNAVDHGIEPLAERRNAGKPDEATVRVAIEPTADGRVSITVSDDGRGLDIEKLKSAAVRSRAISVQQAQKLTEEDAIDLAFRSGVSTSPVISNISGNGIGLAIVRERVERIEGRLQIRSQTGVGSTITLNLPTSVATFRGFLVGVGPSKILWSFDAIERAISVPCNEAAASLARGSFTFEGQALPIGRLSDIMGYTAAAPNASQTRKTPAIVVRNDDHRGVLLVEDIIGETEIVLKELRAPLRRVRNVMTAGLLGTGELILVARPSDVLASIGIRVSRPEAGRTRETVRTIRLLVVDDSITTRTMERNMLEAAGYHVKTASDGIEALTLLQNETFDLIVSDVERLCENEQAQVQSGAAGPIPLPPHIAPSSFGTPRIAITRFRL